MTDVSVKGFVLRDGAVLLLLNERQKRDVRIVTFGCPEVTMNDAVFSNAWARMA